MKTIHGDLLELAKAGAFDVIVHGCNCFCTMGRGIAKSIKAEFPEAYAADCATATGDRAKLGSISVAMIVRDGRSLAVINAYTQHDFRGSDPNVDYAAIRQAFREIRRQFPGRRIGYPKIGAGLARGDWATISAIIDEELAGEDHTLVLLEPVPATEPVANGINIFSGAGGLGSALTNPTELAREKGQLRQRYPVQFLGKLWPDAEAAYHHFKRGHAADDDRLMSEIIAAKLRQHPRLLEAISVRGGDAFLRACAHFTGARTDSSKAWEGQGVESRFIRNLIAGYALALSPGLVLAKGEQQRLF